MRGFLERLGESFQGLMRGRNGSDALSIASLIGAFVIVLVNSFVPSIVLSLLGYALLVYSIFRVLSRNIAARSAENERFEALLGRIRRKGPDSGPKSAPKGTREPRDGTRMRFRCEQCGQSLSVPKGRGTLKVTCPKCHHQTRIES